MYLLQPKTDGERTKDADLISNFLTEVLRSVILLAIIRVVLPVVGAEVLTHIASVPLVSTTGYLEVSAAFRYTLLTLFWLGILLGGEAN